MEQSSWDIILTGFVLGTLGLLVWSRISGMTIAELISSIRDFFRDSGEEVVSEAMVWDE